MNSGRSRLLLIDGHAVVFRAWFAIREDLATSSGVPTRGVMGFTNILLKTLRQQTPTHVAVAFDTRGPTFREKEYPQYKAHRPPVDPALHEQLPMVREVLQALQIPCYELTSYEADDLVGTISARAAAQSVDVLILTCDSDLLQLVTDDIKVLMHSGFGRESARLYDVEAVAERYGGLGPGHVPQIKALAGDKSDNIPGVPGVGEKTAIALLQEFDSLQGIYANLDKISALPGLRGAKRVQGLLGDHRQEAFSSLRLAQIVTDAPIGFDLADARYGDYEPEQVREVLLKYELRVLAKDFSPLDGDDARSGADTASDAAPQVPAGPVIDCKIIDDDAKFADFVATVKTADMVAFDTETTGLDPLVCKLAGISFAVRAGHGWYLPLGHREGRQLELSAVLPTLREIFADDRIAKVAHNANFDMMVLGAIGVRIANVEFDTMIAAALCGHRQLGIKQLALNLLKEQMTPITDLVGTGRKQITMDEVDIPRAAAYAVADAEVALRLRAHLAVELEQYRQTRVFEEMEMPLLPVMVMMQLRGVLLAPDKLKGMSVELAVELDLVDRELRRTVLYTLPGTEEFNINSPKQIGELLFERLGAPHRRRTKTGWSADESTLEWLLEKEGLDERVYCLVNCVRRHRELAKLKATYVDALPRLVNPRTSRVHTTFNQVGAATGRLASNNPNMQNIPVRTSLGRRVRGAFHADTAAGWSLLSADYSQIELRILAHMAREPGLIEAFRRGEDIHASTARAMYGVEQVTPEQRRIAKILNFGVIYGMGPHGVARQTDLTRQQGREFIDLYFGKYPGIKDFIEEVKAQARINGYVQTIAGRRRYLPALRSNNQGQRAAAERFAVNMPIQGTAADIIKIAMIAIGRELHDHGAQSKMLVQVHDELLFEVAPGERKDLTGMVTARMIGAMELIVPMEVSLKHGDNWGEMA